MGADIESALFHAKYGADVESARVITKLVERLRLAEAVVEAARMECCFKKTWDALAAYDRTVKAGANDDRRD